MSNRSRSRTIFIEHDNLDMTAGGGDQYLAEYDYSLRSWVVEYGVAADLISNWEHDRPDRASVEKHGLFALSSITPGGGAEVAVWSPIVGGGMGSVSEYTISSFPFGRAIEVTTPMPARVSPTPRPTDAAFAEFGKRAAAILAGSTEWNSDTTEALGTAASSFLGVAIDDTMNEETWLMWKPLVEQAGMEMWDYEDEED